MEVQEIKIDGTVYVPIEDKCPNIFCDGCALSGNCILIDVPELDEKINPCGLFKHKILKVKK